MAEKNKKPPFFREKNDGKPQFLVIINIGRVAPAADARCAKKRFACFDWQKFGTFRFFL
jgi:hypothetical protein